MHSTRTAPQAGGAGLLITCRESSIGRTEVIVYPRKGKGAQQATQGAAAPPSSQQSLVHTPCLQIGCAHT